MHEYANINSNDSGVKNMDNVQSDIVQEYVIIKALKDGVNIIGMTRGRDTKFHHTEILDKGEVMIAQFTENTSAIKIRGNAQIYTKHGVVISGDSE
jgi:transcription attenuation protein (tryptophan RNA-binding attenuator protein)